MADIVTRRELEDAKIDAKDLGEAVNEKKIVSPRYGGDFKSIPLIAEEGNQEITNLQNAIEIAAAAGAGENGWTAQLIVDASGETQQKINNESVRYFTSLSNLLTYKPKNNGQLVKLSSYHGGGQLGGSDMIAIQSSILTENGVTVFRSSVVGYENYFWVRVNINHITPEMAGAVGDKSYNCRDAFQKCLNIGGKIVLNNASNYLVHKTDSDSTIPVLLGNKPTTLYCGGKANIFFRHNLTTESPTSLIFKGVNNQLSDVTLEGVNFIGNPTIGQANKTARTWGVQLRGVDNFNIKRCKFSTMQGHNLGIYRRDYENNGDWIQSSNLNVANTSAAVLRLKELSSKNGIVENIQLEHCGSTGFAIFGGSNISVDTVAADITGSTFPYAVWTDDASSQTPLRSYAVNDNIRIRGVTSNGDILLDGCASGSITESQVPRIGIRSYDFDQQKNNFDSGSHTYNVNDHIDAPFMWMNFLNRGIKVHDNICNRFVLRTIYADIYDNTLFSTAAGHKFLTLDTNAIAWGTGVSYTDADTVRNVGVKSNIKNNTFVLRHDNCTGLDYGTTSANSFWNALDNIFEKTDVAFVFTPARYASSPQRRDSYFTTDENTGTRLLKKVNHHVDIDQALLTQGLGSNYLSTVVAVRGGIAAQPIMKFSTTANVYAELRIVTASGLVMRKQLTVTDTGALTVTSLDGSTDWNTGVFARATVSGDYQIQATVPTGADCLIDIKAVGGYTATVFKMTDSRGIGT